MISVRLFLIASISSISIGACAGADDPQSAGAGGATSSGGMTSSTGGTPDGSGGAVSTGGALGNTGGTTTSGGSDSGGSDSGGTGGDGSGGWTAGNIPKGNPPVGSDGCGQATTITTQQYTISSSGQDRVYYVDMPSDYDENKPYRLFYTSHWIGSKWQDVESQDFYFLKPLIEADGEQAIFVAPSSDGATWQEKDHALFDDIMAHLNENLCFDTTRVFATGFSFGGMITYSLSTNHQQEIRAAVGIAPANYNIWLPEKTHEPIAWMHITGMSDTLCPWVNNEQQQRGAKFIAIEKATDNGCTVPNDIPVWQNGAHTCYDFEDCNPEHPTRVCTFGGGHTNIDVEQGENWIPRESWDFFKQF